MSQIKPKQLKLAASGSLLVGGPDGQGSSLDRGSDGQILRVVNGAVSWSTLTIDTDSISSTNGLNKVSVTDGNGAKIEVEDSTGAAKSTLVEFLAGSIDDSKLQFSSQLGNVTVRAVGEADDVNLHLIPQGEGAVIIGNSGDSQIQGEDNTDLAILGGAGQGNLLLNGGGTGKVYYGDTSTDPDREVATKGDLTALGGTISNSATRREFDGGQVVDLADAAATSSIIISINGLVLADELYTIDPDTKVVSFVGLPYTLDANDKIIATYNVAA